MNRTALTDYRIVKKDNKFSIEKKTQTGSWVQFEYGIPLTNSFIIIEDSEENAIKVLFENMNNYIGITMSTSSGWEVVRYL